MTQQIDTNIQIVGKAKIDNPAIGPYVDDTPIPFYLDVEHAGEDAKGLDAPVFLEQAGPRAHV